MSWQLARCIESSNPKWVGRVLWVKAERPSSMGDPPVADLMSLQECLDVPAFPCFLTATGFKYLRARADQMELLPVFAENVPEISVRAWEKMSEDEIKALGSTDED